MNLPATTAVAALLVTLCAGRVARATVAPVAVANRAALRRAAEKGAFEAMLARVDAAFAHPDARVRRAAVERAILALYARQTTDEQAARDTRYDNAVGFSAADAARCSFVATFLQQTWDDGSPKHLSLATAERYLPRVVKYRRQLASIALEKAASKAAA